MTDVELLKEDSDFLAMDVPRPRSPGTAEEEASFKSSTSVMEILNMGLMILKGVKLLIDDGLAVLLRKGRIVVKIEFVFIVESLDDLLEF